MKILFSMRHPGALRNFASTIRELAGRGHDVHLAFVMQDKLGDGQLLWELTDDFPERHSRGADQEDPVSVLAGAGPRRAVLERLPPVSRS